MIQPLYKSALKAGLGWIAAFQHRLGRSWAVSAITTEKDRGGAKLRDARRAVDKLFLYHVAMTTKVRRRLTTLLCADVEGYARLMGADETGTMETLRRYRAAMATRSSATTGGVVNTWGDAVIADFPSVVEAVQCAVETQQELSTNNGGLPEPRRMIFRIGIHLGDVMVEGDDVHGDGVNIAARLQERAEPGES